MSTLSGWLDVVVAISPIVVILVAMVILRKSAAFAGIVGLVLTTGLAGFYFGFPALEQLSRPIAAGLAGAFLESGFTAATILWIIFGALCLYHLQIKTGAMDSLRQALGALSDDPRVMAILIAWFFALFMEGAAGFGTPVALAAPFLVGFGFHPVQAVTITLIGHSVGVSFGAVGTPIIPQVAVTDWSGAEIAAVTGEYHVLFGAIMLALLLFLVTRRAHRESTELVPIAKWFALGAAGFLLPMWVLSRWVGPELPTMGGAIIGGLLFIGGLHLARLIAGDETSQDPKETATRDGAPMPLWRAASPYLIVIALVLITRLPPSIQAAAQAIELHWELFSHFQGNFQPLYHPGTLLMVGFGLGAWLQGASRHDVVESLRDSLVMLAPVTVALVAMLAISRLMVHATMIDILADAAASTAGPLWPAFAPLVGVLGTFVTGSATASNILFTDFQVATADRLGFDQLRLIGAQGFGAAVGNIVAPHNIIAGCATVGIAGQEGDILRRTLGACALYVVLGGVLTWVLVQ